MSAKACTSGSDVLDLWKIADSTNRQSYTVKRTSGSGLGIIGVSMHEWILKTTRSGLGRRHVKGHLPRVGCPTQINTTIVDMGRATEGCNAYLSVGTVAVGQCQTTTSGLGSSASPIATVTKKRLAALNAHRRRCLLLLIAFTSQLAIRLHQRAAEVPATLGSNCRRAAS